MSEVSAAPLLTKGVEISETINLEKRRTPELVIGVVGPIGSGVSFTAQIIGEILEKEFGYTPQSYKISKIIKDACSLIDEQYDEAIKGAQRISRLQTLGNRLREKFGNSYLAEKVIEKIAAIRLEHGYKKKGDPSVPLPLRYVHIIDSLKNPHEARLLRDVYGETFWLVGVFAPQETRQSRLKENMGIAERDLPALLERDEDEGFAAGQKVRDTIYDSDFFVRNDGENDVHLRRTLGRFLNIFFNISVETPTQDESAMYTAVSAAANSACLSRQVGAAIYSAGGELIGIGANDVPKFGGGLYGVEDGDSDHRCFKFGGKICHNDDHKEQLYQRIAQQLIEGKLVDKKLDFGALRGALLKTDIRNLIEFSRAVHAEMEAIISVGRGNKAGLVGSTLYCTTFPCHSCARHIVAAGIKRVVYIEPYPKSLATVLHKDAISIKSSDADKHVVFLQYDGVAPKNIVKFFKHGIPRKADGRAVTRSPKTAEPVLQPMLDGYATLEQIVVNNLDVVEKAAKQKPGG